MRQKLVGFPPVSTPSATMLILGSMPGARSLLAGEYYAHPQNCFWKIMGRLTGLDPKEPYSERLKVLCTARIAVWDVVQSCQRRGSLDANIKADSIIVNEFGQFFRDHPLIDVVCFNGTAAEQTFNKYVLPTLNSHSLKFVRLPSTSPAHTLSLDQKVQAWQLAIRPQ